MHYSVVLVFILVIAVLVWLCCGGCETTTHKKKKSKCAKKKHCCSSSESGCCPCTSSPADFTESINVGSSGAKKNLTVSGDTNLEGDLIVGGTYTQSEPSSTIQFYDEPTVIPTPFSTVITLTAAQIATRIVVTGSPANSEAVGLTFPNGSDIAADPTLSKFNQVGAVFTVLVVHCHPQNGANNVVVRGGTNSELVIQNLISVPILGLRSREFVFRNTAPATWIVY